jgi:hypothetical protein
MASDLIHRFGAMGGTPVNAYLTVSDGRAPRARVEELGKPLLGGFITHTHAEHYGAPRTPMEGLER